MRCDASGACMCGPPPDGDLTWRAAGAEGPFPWQACAQAGQLTALAYDRSWAGPSHRNVRRIELIQDELLARPASIAAPFHQCMPCRSPVASSALGYRPGVKELKRLKSATGWESNGAERSGAAGGAPQSKTNSRGALLTTKIRIVFSQKVR